MTANQVFLVHAHDSRMRSRVEKWLRELGVDPIVLHQLPDKGRTIIEKIEDYSNVISAIVLLSPDDEGRRKWSRRKRDRCKPRARQNVILELGYFMGKLGRNKVHVLYRDQKNMELPTDFGGVLYTPFKGATYWRFRVATELKAAGCQIDERKLPRAVKDQLILQASDYVSILTGSKWTLYFNPQGGNKTITFLANGLVGEGRNKNESSWRMVGDKLEFINSEGQVFSRFIYDSIQSRWIHTNEADTRSIKGQYILKVTPPS
jgi:hypothetical protein